MYLPKADVFRALSVLPYTIIQTNQSVFSDLPAVTFHVGDNRPRLTLENEIAYQDIIVHVDIWAEDSLTASRMVSEIETIMRTELYYQIEFCADIPNPDSSVFHISTRFRK